MCIHTGAHLPLLPRKGPLSLSVFLNSNVSVSLTLANARAVSNGLERGKLRERRCRRCADADVQKALDERGPQMNLTQTEQSQTPQKMLTRFCVKHMCRIDVPAFHVW